ncbi:MAG: SulP family inorganic anion transporter [Myxococcota bacterium]
MLTRIREQWLSNPVGDLLAGTVVALALIPEAIAFSIIAGVDPAVGLYASFCIAVITSFTGGRPAMISAATGAMALVVVPLVAEHGLPYLLAATVLTGVIQLGFSALRLARYIKFVPSAVMTGFVNALAILIFMAQLPQLIDVTWITYAMVAAGLGIIYLLPLVTKRIPAPLVAIVLLTIVSYFSGFNVNTVGDMGQLPSGLPFLALPGIPWTLETLQIILPYSFALAIVGLIESLLTARIVDDQTDTGSNKHHVARGQGIANIVTGFFGGMAGCAMIGQSMINVASGGRTRLSTLWAGVLLLGLIVGLGDVVGVIPMPALVAVMIMVSISTFDWSSIKRIFVMPRSEAIVLLATVGVVVYTHDLSQGVIAGVLLSAVFFARVVGKLVDVESTIEGDTRTFAVTGQLFFVSVEAFLDAIDYDTVETNVVIDLSASHIWDGTAVEAVDKAVLKLRERGRTVTLHGLNEASHVLVERLGNHQKPGAVRTVGH